MLAAWWAQPKPAAVRSSSLVEDRADTSFAGQFESFLGVTDDNEFLIALRACWAALWTTNARRSMAQHGLDPAGTAMAVLVQPLVAARVSGGGLSETADGHMLLSATWGLGSAIAQGEVVPDRIVLSATVSCDRTTPAASITATPACMVLQTAPPQCRSGFRTNWCARRASKPARRPRSAG